MASDLEIWSNLHLHTYINHPDVLIASTLTLHVVLSWVTVDSVFNLFEILKIHVDYKQRTHNIF